uniref:DUF1618 domain-containing protein n=1 Tax=Leersia perrieri TaxID=77586 RepID=A0A0D9X372_9ORYZ
MRSTSSSKRQYGADRGSREEEERCVVKRQRPEKRKKHLYLMLDDWEHGYRMHKIDVDSPALSDPRLPEPALLQFGTPPTSQRRYGMCFSALGSSIFATQPPDTPSLVYDTDTGGLTVGSPLPDTLRGGGPGITVSIGGKMYALYAYSTCQPHPFEVMSWATDTDDPSSSSSWSWKTVPSPPPYGEYREITSYAVHPDDRTLFISVRECFVEHGGAKGTYSFDTKHCEWRWHGHWMLPFQERQRLAASYPGIQPTLVYMGGSSFCLLEYVLPEGALFDDASCCSSLLLLRLTIFGLKYDHKGDLRTSIHRTNASYLLSKHDRSYSPVAFWM